MLHLLDLAVIIAAVAMKSLFFFSYKSTDFEVHRNWMAVTHNTSLSEWYSENTSQWTLDYPPLFAAYEWLLANLAYPIDPNMLVISKEAYVSDALIIFQRCTVIISELLFIFAVNSLLKTILGEGSNKNKNVGTYYMALFSLNFGLFVVDHIHFQYNGFLFGFLFLSIASIFRKDYISSSFWFAVLLNMKHIFIYLSPVYLTFMFLRYCLTKKNTSYRFQLMNFISLGLTVLAVFTISLGPFVYLGKIWNVFDRLFPFHRGLCHAYWAPNFWAIYNIADKALSYCGIFDSYCANDVNALSNNIVSMSSGLTGDYIHECLVTIRPLHTALLTAVFMVPSLVICKTKDDETPVDSGLTLLRAIVAAAWAAFLFGWHVHEKAILMVTLPLILLSVASRKIRGLAFYVVTISHFSLLPLVFTPAEQPAVLSMFTAFTIAMYILPCRSSPPTIAGALRVCWPFLSLLARIHLLGLLPLLIATRYVIPALYPHLQFLPLMVVSVYCASGIFSSFVVYLWINFDWLFRPDPQQDEDEIQFEIVNFCKKTN